MFSGVYRRAVRWKSTDVSEGKVASIFRVFFMLACCLVYSAGFFAHSSVLINVGWLSTDCAVLYPIRKNSSFSVFGEFQLYYLCSGIMNVPLWDSWPIDHKSSSFSSNFRITPSGLFTSELFWHRAVGVNRQSQGRCLHRATQTQKKHRQTSMPWGMPMFERAFHALDCRAAVTGYHKSSEINSICLYRKVKYESVTSILKIKVDARSEACIFFTVWILE
jgi:hypothetical protein